MILVRNVFRLKFGKAKEAVELWKQAIEIMRSLNIGSNHRVLTDLVGAPFYTLVVEMTFPSLAEMEQTMQKAFGNEEWSRHYQKVIPLVESGQREIFNIVQ